MLGIVSLIIWSVMIIVTIKDVLLVMRADNDGEGGILAFVTLIQRRVATGGRRTKVISAGLGIFGALLFFGDSMITPVISVLSAVKGLKIVQPSLEPALVRLAAVIILVLFAFQRLGTAKVGRLSGAGDDHLVRRDRCRRRGRRGGAPGRGRRPVPDVRAGSPTGTITITTVLDLPVVRKHWHQRLGPVLVGAAVFLGLELLFFAATSPSWPTGPGYRC